MSNLDVLYDAGRTPTPLGGPLFPALLGVGIISAAVLIWRPELGRGRDATTNRVGAAVFLLAASIAFGVSVAPIPFAYWARFQVQSGRTFAVEGCVRQFERDVHPNGHGMTDTYFRLADRDYHFNSGSWWPGYRDEDDAIRPDDHLRVQMTGPSVLKIERLKAGCA